MHLEEREETPVATVSRQVFISHASQDREAAQATCAALEDHGITCWMAPRDIVPGQSFGESVINAIRHGNENDARKRVHVQFTTLNGAQAPGLEIRVRDEGAGFDPAELPNCLAPENLLKSSGRGIFLIRSFMDELVLQRAPQGGMEVFMVKRANNAPNPA